MALTFALAPPLLAAFSLPEFLKKPTVRGVRHSILVYDLDRETPLATFQDDLQIIPASNMKFITALAALDTFGANYQFETPFYLIPGPAGGPPSLYVNLSGDPSWHKAFYPSVRDMLSPVIGALRGQGIGRLSGVMVNDALMPAFGRPPDWDVRDFPYDYAPVSSAAGLERNAFTLQVGPGCAGGKPQVSIYPPQRVVNVENWMSCGGGRVGIGTRKTGRNTFRVQGNWRAGRTYQEDFSVDDPAVFLADAITMALAQSGFMFERGAAVVRQPPPENSIELYRMRSAPLSAILAFMLHKSDNFTAENLFHLTGVRMSNQVGLQGARQGMALWLARKGLGGIRMMDGSGLSRSNRMSARELGRAYLIAWKEPNLQSIFQELAVAGQSGTLQKRFRDKNTAITQGHFRGKTGAMNGVSSLSGVLRTLHGKNILFVSMQNGHSNGNAIRSWQDYAVTSLYKTY